MVAIPITSDQNHAEADGNWVELKIGYVCFGGRLEAAKYRGNMALWTRTRQWPRSYDLDVQPRDLG
jgi:hypothetical protein